MHDTYLNFHFASDCIVYIRDNQTVYTDNHLAKKKELHTYKPPRDSMAGGDTFQI